MDKSGSALADFDIDSGVSGADLLELKQGINRLRPERIQRGMADSIISAQEMTLQRWKRYASFSALSSCTSSY